MTDTVRAKCPDCGGRTWTCERCKGSGQVFFKMPTEVYSTFCPECRGIVGGGDASFLTPERAAQVLARLCPFCDHAGLQFIPDESDSA